MGNDKRIWNHIQIFCYLEWWDGVGLFYHDYGDYDEDVDVGVVVDDGCAGAGNGHVIQSTG